MLSSVSFRYKNQYDTDALIYFRAVEQVSSFDLTSVQPWLTPTYVKFWINNLVIRLKENGSWNSIHSCVLMRCTSSLAGALIPLKGTAPTNNNFVEGDYNPITGLKGNGSNKWLSCNVNNNVFPRGSMHMSTWITESDTRSGIETRILGTSANWGGSYIYILTNNNWAWANQHTTANVSVGARPSPVGLVAHSRSDASVISYMSPGGNAATTTSAVQTPYSENITLFSYNGTGVTDARLSWYSLGLGLDLNSLRDSVTVLNEAMVSLMPMPAGIGEEVGWWCPSLDDAGNETTTLNDLSGYSNEGSLTGMDAATDWVVDTENGGIRALDFDGSNDYVTGPPGIVKSLSIGTVAFWVKTSREVEICFSVYVKDSLGTGLYIALGQNVTGAFTDELVSFARVIGGSITNQFAYTTANRTEILDDNWHHICVVFNGYYELYVDGTPKTISFSTYPNNGAFCNGLTGVDRLSIGARDVSASPLYFQGRMDDIRVFDRALTSEEIALLSSKRGYPDNYPNNKTRIDKGYVPYMKIISR